MPIKLPDTRFTTGGTVFSYSESEVRVTLHVTRVYTIELELIHFPSLRLAHNMSASFIQPQEIYQDLQAFTQMLPRIPLAIPRGYRLPYWYFMNSPWAEPEYFTFQKDCYLHRIDYTPVIRADTEISFPLTLSMTFSYDTILVYRYDSHREKPITPPSGYDRSTWEKWTFDTPNSGWVLNDSAVESFERIDSDPKYSFFLYCDSMGFWKEQVFTEEEQQFSVFFNHCGFRTDTNGRTYLYGDTADLSGEFPYHSIEDIPPSSYMHNVIFTSGQVSGYWRGFKAPAPSSVYPPDSKNLTVQLPPFIPLLGRIIKPIQPGLFIPVVKEWSKVLDGTWNLNDGGIFIL